MQLPLNKEEEGGGGGGRDGVRRRVRGAVKRLRIGGNEICTHGERRSVYPGVASRRGAGTLIRPETALKVRTAMRCMRFQGVERYCRCLGGSR